MPALEQPLLRSAPEEEGSRDQEVATIMSHLCNMIPKKVLGIVSGQQDVKRNSV